MLRPLKALLAFLSLVVLNGCGFHEVSSSTSAYVSAEQAERAFTKLSQIDYLPFGYKLDGCYARSLFMAMELASEGIPSSAQFAVGDLQPTEQISWRYHVVPMLIVGNATEPTVIDPSILSQPSKRSDWLRAMHADGFTELVAVPGSYYDPYSTPPKSEEHIIHSFAEMPAFQLEDVTRACRTLSAYLNNEHAPNLSQKHQKLAARAVQLGTTLQRLGKLKTDESFSGRESGPIEIDCDGSPFD